MGSGKSMEPECDGWNAKGIRVVPLPSMLVDERGRRGGFGLLWLALEGGIECIRVIIIDNNVVPWDRSNRVGICSYIADSSSFSGENGQGASGRLDQSL